MDTVICIAIVLVFFLVNEWGHNHAGKILDVNDGIRFAYLMITFNMALIGVTLVLAYIYR
jgi:hypothetical protein